MKLDCGVEGLWTAWRRMLDSLEDAVIGRGEIWCSRL